jgi:hypothetical protein
MYVSMRATAQGPISIDKADVSQRIPLNVGRLSVCKYVSIWKQAAAESETPNNKKYAAFMDIVRG